MIDYIRTIFFTYPQFDEDEKTLRARLLFELTWVIISIGVIAIGFSFLPITYAPIYFKLGVTALIVPGINILLLKRGWIRFISIEIVSILAITFFILPFTFGGISSASLAFQFTSVLLAFVLLSARSGIGFLLITIFGNLAFLVTEEAGIYIPTPPDSLPLTSFAVHTIALVFASGTIFSFRIALDRMLKRFYVSENSLKLRNRQLLSLQDVSIAFSGSLDLKDVLEKITAEISGFTNFERCYISEWNEQEGTLIAIAAHHPDDWSEYDSTFTTYKLSEYPSTLRVLKEQVPEQFLYHQENLDPSEKAYMEEEELVMMLLIPMVYQGKTIGLVEIEDSQTEHSVTEDDLNLIQLLSNQAANAIVNARLFDQAQTELEDRRRTEQVLERKNRQLIALQATNTTISSNMELTELLNMISTQLVNYFDIQICSTSLWNKDKNTIQMIAFHYPQGWIEEKDSEKYLQPHPLSEFPISREVLLTQTPRQLQRSDPNLDFAEHASIDKEKIHSNLIVPLISQFVAIGIIELKSVERTHQFADEDIAMVQQVANQVANAIISRQLYDQAQLEIAERARTEYDLALQNERLIAIQKASAQVNATFDILVTLKVIGKELSKLLSMESCFICEWDKDSNFLTSIGGYWPEDRGEDRYSASFRLDDFPFTRAIMMRQVSALLRISQPNLDAAEKAYMESEGVKTLLHLPMIYQGECIGLIEIVDSKKERLLNENDIALAKLLTDQAAIAIINARLFQETERRLAEQITLRETVSFISSTLDIDEVLKHITEQAVTALNCTSGYISFFEPGSNFYTVRGEFLSPEASGSEIISDLGEKYEETDEQFLFYMRMGRHKVEYIGELPINDPTRLHMEKFNSKTILYYPLLLGGELIGLLELWDSRVNRIFKEPDIRLGNDIAKQAAIAINNASLYQQLQSQADVLEARVKERTDELRAAYDDILAAKLEADSANKSKSTFLATMSHEIRTPINAVTGMTELLMNTPLNDQQLRLAKNIMTGGDTLLALINDILDFSKIEAGRLDLEEEPFNLRTVIEDSFDMVVQAAASKRLHLTYKFGEDLPGAFYGDSVRVRQILVNLLSNAVKFTNKGKIELNVDSVDPRENKEIQISVAKSMFDKVKTLLFSVSDSGIGIPEARISDLFNPFRQLDASTTRQFGGTGLGLAISERLVESMGGRIWLESEVGKGTTFYFTLQLPLAPFTPPHYLQNNQPEFTNKQILVAIPQGTNRLTLSRRFSNWGMQVKTAAVRREVQTHLAEMPSLDVLCIDEEMVFQSDGSLFHFIRRSYPKLPIVILGTFGMKIEENDPVLFRVYKPIKVSELYRKLKDALSSEIIEQKSDSQSDQPGLIQSISNEYPQRILFVEDNEMNQDLILQVLDRLGFKATIANNGIEALEAMKVSTFDTILMDIQMPVMDGMETARRIRAMNLASKQPYIIVLTANAMAGDREAYLAAGMNDYINKPFRILEISDALKKAYETRKNENFGKVETDANNHSPGTTASEYLPIFEPKAIKQLREMLGQQSGIMLPQLMEKFTKQIPDLINTAISSKEAEDMDELRRAVHTIKSNSANFGALRLSDQAREVERAVRDDNLQDFQKKILDIASAFEVAKEEIEKYMVSENNL